MKSPAMTKHAQSRVQARGIPAIVIELLLSHGDETRTRDGYIRFFSKGARRRLARALGGRRSLALLEPFLNCYLVEGDNGNLVTAGHRQTRIQRNWKTH